MMPSILIIGLIIFTGFLFGEAAKKIGLPKVTGYILGGVLLNPGLFKVIPMNFLDHTAIITNISLSFITFSVGGTLLFSKIRQLGKSILWITVFEAQTAFLMVFLGFFFLSPALAHIPNITAAATLIPLSLFMASLASPTDPSATLAVMHEYKAKGTVSSTIMSVAAFDDVLGILNYSFAAAVSLFLVSHQAFDWSMSVLAPLITIAGAVSIGIVLGVSFNFLIHIFEKETKGSLIVITFALIFISFGLAKYLHSDELLANMTMGLVVVNFNRQSEKIFQIMERYTEELILALFFTVSGMHLDFSVMPQAAVLILIFFILRAIGKFFGTWMGAVISNAEPNVKRYTAGGLIPQGGIVIGLALLIHQQPSFSNISQLIMNVVIGATILHEFIGPVISKIALKKAGEI